eukprot:4817775-Pyramimonas_sp.AAC.1
MLTLASPSSPLVPLSLSVLVPRTASLIYPLCHRTKVPMLSFRPAAGPISQLLHMTTTLYLSPP